MKYILNNFVVLATLIGIIGNMGVSAVIRNINVDRSVNLEEAGSNLVIFQTQIAFAVEGLSQYYYYAIAKDYEWSFVALQITTEDPYNPGSTLTLKYDKLDSLPADFDGTFEAGALENIIVHRIELQDFQMKGSDNKKMVVREFHKGRREPYPKVIRVYEK